MVSFLPQYPDYQRPGARQVFFFLFFLNVEIEANAGNNNFYPAYNKSHVFCFLQMF